MEEGLRQRGYLGSFLSPFGCSLLCLNPRLLDHLGCSCKGRSRKVNRLERVISCHNLDLGAEDSKELRTRPSFTPARVYGRRFVQRRR